MILHKNDTLIFFDLNLKQFNGHLLKRHIKLTGNFQLIPRNIFKHSNQIQKHWTFNLLYQIIFVEESRVRVSLKMLNKIK